jgi:predicted transposase/invertase (TIGR01784 family)
MAGTTDKYINLFTDFGFKKLFGEEPNKDLLISFLNALLADEEQISDLSYLKNERLGKNEDERKAVYDMYCTNAEGEKFIVEIQRVKQEFFKDRSLYYATFAIQEQALKGRRWNYKLKKVYTIAVLDFEFEDTKPDKLHHRVSLMEEETKEIFYERLRFIYLEIPKFSKELKELTSDYERWLFAFKNLHRLREMPKELEEGLFNKLFELAEIAKMKPKEQTVYRDSLKDYWDLKNAMETYLKEGKALGLAEGLAEGKAKGLVEGKNKGILEAKVLVAKQMLKDGEPVDKIIRYTGLSAAELEALI